jgi:TolB-like protein/Tfp pilus assembly protein PilF
LYLFEDYALDTDQRELRRGDSVVAIQPQVFDLLEYLIGQRHRVVSKDDLIAGVWGGRIVSESALTTRINHARVAVGDSGEEQRLIRTLPRKGIRFVGVVHGADPAKIPKTVSAVAPKTESAQPDRPSIIVLPFTNMSGDSEQDYFADGITEDIITALSKWRSFYVIARNSAFIYKGRNVDVKQIGRELNVRYVLEGSVRRAGARLRITAQLIDTVSAIHVWADRYDRELTDVFAIQDDLSLRIAAVVEPELGRHEQQRAAAMPPASLEAWDCHNRGLYLLYKFTRDDIAAARPFFERAIALDPNFSRAHSGLAYTHQLDVLHGYSSDDARSIDQHIIHARRGVELDGSDSFAHLMLAFGYRWRNHELAVAEARKAVECNPNDTWAQATLGLCLDILGQHREGARMMEHALALHPRELHVRFYPTLIARAYLVDRDYAAAETWAWRGVENDAMNPRTHLILAAVLGHLDRTQEARAALDAGERLAPRFAGRWISRVEYRSNADNEHVTEGLRKAGLRVKTSSG